MVVDNKSAGSPRSPPAPAPTRIIQIDPDPVDEDNSDEDEEDETTVDIKEANIPFHDPSLPMLPLIFQQNDKQLNMQRVRRASSQVEKYGAVGTIAITQGNTCYSYICALIYLTIASGINIGCIVIGSVYLKNCSEQPNLPIILITVGVLTFLITISDILGLVSQHSSDPADDSDDDEERNISVNTTTTPNQDGGGQGDYSSTCTISFMALIRLTNFGLFIYFCVLVFSIQPPKLGDSYCGEVVYWYSFVYVIICLVEMSLGIVCCISCCCCCCCCVLPCTCCGSKGRGQSGTTGNDDTDGNRRNLQQMQPTRRRRTPRTGTGTGTAKRPKRTPAAGTQNQPRPRRPRQIQQQPGIIFWSYHREEHY